MSGKDRNLVSCLNIGLGPSGDGRPFGVHTAGNRYREPKTLLDPPRVRPDHGSPSPTDDSPDPTAPGPTPHGPGGDGTKGAKAQPDPTHLSTRDE